MRKPRIFIASSVESLGVAEAINVNLDHEFEVTIWKNGTFKLSSTSVDDLVTKSSAVDFALFIFAPDDIATIRSRDQHVVRDNVLFEMGLFVGAIGKERTFFIKPRNQEMYLPTDLLGLMPADYEANRSDGDLVSATNRACSLIKAEVKRLGLLNRESLKANTVVEVNSKNYPILEADLAFLSAVLSSHTSHPEGRSFFQICSDIGGDDSKLSLAAIKLERLGYIEKTIEHDSWGNALYHYSINESGIDVLLESELAR
ncbi:conserved hypothetical protein [Vibrio mimicus VM603]|uniref:CD-NTase-associated protein 12/Pycsar effector protein TIR domain-containing protein n=1 Tax=Vibrio mimicus VM603 TaxID=671074 RepID=D2YCG8_VIBMI|nr:nucleotide-binding protein [Vibrio mimicus]EEW07554.1 conserved hypothetical protein [Vibrio mimicus VM603]